MKKIKTIIKEILNEYVIFDYKNDNNDKYRISYSFDANGLKYFVSIWHNSAKHYANEYEVEFGFKTQKHSGDKANKDLSHLNSVLYTVMTIVEEAIKKYKIKYIKIEGAASEDEDDIFNTTRADLYYRLIKNKYPNDAIEKSLRFIKIDMTKVFPDLFKNQENKIDELFEIIINISDENPDVEDLKRGFEGIDNNFYYGSDYIINSKLGHMELNITVNGDMKEYSVEYNIIDIDKSDTKDFQSYEKLILFLKNFINNVESNN
jgi:hypothetical protein